MIDYSKGRSEEELEQFFPNEILRHTLLTFLLISAIILGVLFIPESFQKATGEFSSYQVRPTWFLLPFSCLFNLISSKILTLFVLVIYSIVFISIPFIDRNAERSILKKPFFLSAVGINLLMILALGMIRLFL